MKKVLSFVGGVLGFLVGVGAYMAVMIMVVGSEDFSTKIGALFAIGGAIGGSSLVGMITKGRSGSTDDREREARLWQAVSQLDHQAIEGLRDVIQPMDIAPLAARWSKDQAWPIKDALIALLTDQTAQAHPVLEAIFRDGLDSPNHDVRCYAYCSLTGDFDSFVELHQGDRATLQAKLQSKGLA